MLLPPSSNRWLTTPFLCLFQQVWCGPLSLFQQVEGFGDSRKRLLCQDLYTCDVNSYDVVDISTSAQSQCHVTVSVGATRPLLPIVSGPPPSRLSYLALSRQLITSFCCIHVCIPACLPAACHHQGSCVCTDLVVTVIYIGDDAEDMSTDCRQQLISLHPIHALEH